MAARHVIALLAVILLFLLVFFHAPRGSTKVTANQGAFVAPGNVHSAALLDGAVAAVSNSRKASKEVIKISKQALSSFPLPVKLKASGTPTPALPEASCRFGELPGRWEWEEDEFYRWHPFMKSDSSCHYKQYMHYSSLKEDFAMQFRGRSIYVIGDSLDRNAVTTFCCRYSDPFSSDENCYKIWRKSHNGVAFWYCERQGLTVGFFFNVGIFDAPYYGQAYSDGKLCCDLNETLHDRIRTQAASFRDIVLGGEEPSLVLVQSHLWDLTHSKWRNDEEYLLLWLKRVKAFVAMLKQTFSTSQMVWRTAGPSLTGGFNETSLARMGALVRGISREMQVEVIDYHSILLTEGPETAILKTDVHPGFSGQLALMNIAFNILADALRRAPKAVAPDLQMT